jgi:hypothetical protein
MADGIQKGRSFSVDLTKIVSQCENWPVVLNRAEVPVLSVKKTAARDKLSPDSHI